MDALIEDPSPGASLATWRAHLAMLEALPEAQRGEMIQLSLESARGMVAFLERRESVASHARSA